MSPVLPLFTPHELLCLLLFLSTRHLLIIVAPCLCCLVMAVVLWPLSLPQRTGRPTVHILKAWDELANVHAHCSWPCYTCFYVYSMFFPSASQNCIFSHLPFILYIHCDIQALRLSNCDVSVVYSPDDLANHLIPPGAFRIILSHVPVLHSFPLGWLRLILSIRKGYGMQTPKGIIKGWWLDMIVPGRNFSFIDAL